MWHPKYQFPEYLKTADTAERNAYFAGKFVLMHERIKWVQKRLDTEFFNASEQHIALVIGPTGVGKSCLAQSILSECYKRVGSDGDSRSLPMVYFEADVHSTGSFSWKDFYKRLLRAIGELESARVYGAADNVSEFGARKYSNKNRSEADLKSDLELRLYEYGVQYILLDEIQHIFKYGGKSEERNLDILKSISNKTGCRFVGLGTYEVSFSVEKSAQLSRRILTVEFPSYSLKSVNEKKQFESAYVGLLAHMPVELESEIANAVEDVFIGCCGCVGILKEWLNRALVLALSSDQAVSLDILKSTRLKGNQLKSIAEEIREGKAFFQEPEDNDIAVLLDVRGRDRGIDAKDKLEKKTGIKRQPGVRKPVRDAVL